MTTIDDRIKGFLKIWEDRKSGILPPVDLVCHCQVCGAPAMGDDALQFTRMSLICKGCLNKESHGDG